MLLKTLSLVNLHGTLTLDITFNEQITLLVGINGSGKTSALNAIDTLLRPDMRRLAVLRYDSLSLEFEEGGMTYVLSATKIEGMVTLAISGGELALKPITIELLNTIDPEDDDATEHYASLAPEDHEKPMWDLLKSFSKPTVIALDRTLSAESENVQYIEAPANSRTKKRLRARSPLGHVQEVTSAKYVDYRSRAIANDDELKAQIVMSALQDPEEFLGERAVNPMTKADIAQLEEKVATYLSRTIKSGDVAQQVRRFFQSTRLVSEGQHRRTIQQERLLDFVDSQYRQIENLAKAFNDYETKNALAFGSLREYLSTINRFFNDSSKELYFDERTGRLVFSTTIDGVRRDAGRSITHLSSGERQVLILFTFLAFASNPNAVFIVDEPELSLHPKWQHEFMDAFLTLRPPSAQLLLATHSPDIVGRFKEACVTLRSRSK